MSWRVFIIVMALIGALPAVHAEWMMLGVGGQTTGGGGGACTGAIDLSLGCPQPMLGL